MKEHELEEWEQKKAEYNFRCAYCGEKTKLTKDHVQPVSKGGTDKIENIVPACRPCNHRKRAKYYDDIHAWKNIKIFRT